MSYIYFSFYLIAILLSPHQWLEGVQIPLEQITAILALLSVLFGSKDEVKNYAFSVHSKYTFALFLWMALSLWVNGVTNSSEWKPGLYDTLYKMYIVYVLAALSITRARHLSFVLSVFVIISLLTAINSVLVRDYDIHLVPGTYVGWLNRVNWIKQYDDANTYAMLLIMAIQPLLLVNMLEKNFLRKSIYGVALLTLVYGVFLTESRGALLGLLAGASILMLQKFTKKTGVIMALVLGVIVWASVPDRMQQLNTEDSSAASRVSFWEAGLDLFYENPLMGIGYRQFAQHVGMDAHNTLVSAFTEFGIIGFILWLIPIYICAKLLIRTRLLDKSNPEHMLIINQGYALMASSVSMLTSLFFISAFFDLFIIWMGLIVAWYGVVIRTGVELGPVFTGGDFMKVVVLSGALIFLIRVVISIA